MAIQTVDTKGIAQRLNLLMTKLGYENPNEFATALGYKRPDNVYNAISGDRMPGVPLLIDITNKFEKVNINWLLTGYGEMLRLNINNKKSGTTIAPDLDKVRQQVNKTRISLRKLSSLLLEYSEENTDQGTVYSEYASDKNQKVDKQSDTTS